MMLQRLHTSATLDLIATGRQSTFASRFDIQFTDDSRRQRRDDMGPITLFDKSFIQSLSADEAVWFDHFTLAIVCPIFYIETLADLAKGPSKRGPPEVIVKDIAGKFPEWGGTPVGFHIDLCIQNLLGYDVPMDARIPRPGGRPVKSGTVFEQTQEDEAFQRWHRGQFLEIERLVAAGWRKALAELDLNAIAKELDVLGIEKRSCRTLEEARDFAQEIVNRKDRSYARLALANLFFNIPAHLHPGIIARWRTAGEPTLDKFAPYAAFALTVEVFFRIAVASNLIAAERVSNRTDVTYLLYLPFCMAFVSSDNLHRRCAQLFMRPDQEFIWGIDLKAALKTINAHFLQLPEDEREKGIPSFAGSPPPGNLLADLWDRHMRKSYRDEPDVRLDPEKEAELVQRFKAFRKQPTLEVADPATLDDDMISIVRSVRRKRGSWWQVSKDLPDQKDDD
jgi:hypothetical protein